MHHGTGKQLAVENFLFVGCLIFSCMVTSCSVRVIRDRFTAWEDGAQVSHLSLLGFGCKQRTKWWTKVWKEILRHLHVSPTFAYGRPHSCMILHHTGVAALPWPPERIKLVDQWMLRVAGTTFRRNSKLLDALPIAPRLEVFPPVYMSTCGM